jgi:secretion/DNA translocation related TadE-like protein
LPATSGEEGSATVHALVLVAVVTAVAVAGSMIGGLVVGQRRAASAADLAALAAAAALGPGAGTAVGGSAACQEAGRVGEANRARVTDCLVQGQEVVVEVEVDVPGLLGRTWQVLGRARAGPATGSGGPGP